MPEGLSLGSTDITIYNIIRENVGQKNIDEFSRVIMIPEGLSSFGDEEVSRAHLSMSLFIALFADLLERVPSAKKYFDRLLNEERTMTFDHGAVRTVLYDRIGDLPKGEESLVRILKALGYYQNHTYSLEKLKMTGRSYTQADYPELIPQYFVSEFHPEKVNDDNFEKAVINVIEESIDPLSDETKQDLDFLLKNIFLPRERCSEFLANITGAFARQHPIPKLKDYKTIYKHSAEMAWISTEGNAFNHATDRVNNLQALVDQENVLGAPMKETIEVSKSTRVLQTAYRADQIERPFIDENGEIIQMEVPGSFFEFIERHIDPESNTLDLQFDASNATAIFKMTEGDHSLVEISNDLDQIE